MKQNKMLTAALVAMMGVSGTALAATNGATGANSTGSTEITLTIPELIRVSDMTDIALGTWDGSSAIGGTDDVCVYDNSGGNYSATFSGDGASSAFTLVNGANTLAYTVTYGGTAVTATTVLAGQSGADTTETDCATAGNNGTIAIAITNAAAAAVPAAAYTGTLTMLVAPE